MTWTIDAKKSGSVYKGKATPKADVTIILADETLIDLASGKVRGLLSLSWVHILTYLAQLNGQKAFMTGKLKTRGNMMLATKLDAVLKVELSHVFFCVPATQNLYHRARRPSFRPIIYHSICKNIIIYSLFMERVFAGADVILRCRWLNNAQALVSNLGNERLVQQRF